MAQMGFFDLSDRYASLDTKKDPLVEINAVVAWEEFRPTLERVWRKPDAEAGQGVATTGRAAAHRRDRLHGTAHHADASSPKRVTF